MRSKAEVGKSKQGSASCSRLIFLVGTPGDDLECPRLIPWRAHPDVTLLGSRQDHRHGFGMDRFDDGFGAVARKPYTRCGPGIGFDLVPPSPLNSVQIPAVLLASDWVGLWRVLGETVCLDKAPALRLQPSSPVRRRRVPDVRDRESTGPWRWWHSPSHRHHLA